MNAREMNELAAAARDALRRKAIDRLSAQRREALENIIRSAAVTGHNGTLIGLNADEILWLADQGFKVTEADDCGSDYWVRW